MTNADGRLTAADLNAHRGTLAERMGIEFHEVSPEVVVATMPVEPNRQPFGLLHGGASVALGETVGSALAFLLAGPGRAAVGVSVTAVHHRAVAAGTVTGRAVVLHAGRTTVSVQIEITDPEDRRVCTCTLVCQLRDLPAGAVTPFSAAGRPGV